MEEVMKKSTVWKIIGVVIALLIAFIYYYITLPAFNLHSTGTWWFLIVLIAALGVYLSIRTGSASGKRGPGGIFTEFRPGTGLPVKISFGIIGVMLVILAIGAFLSSPVINAAKYRDLMTPFGQGFRQPVRRQEDGQYGGNGFPV